jgi:hypothetical protein
LVGRSASLLVSRLVGGLDGKSIGCSVRQLVGRPVNLFFSQLVGCSAVWPVNWLVAQLVSQLAGSSVSRMPSLLGGGSLALGG